MSATQAAVLADTSERLKKLLGIGPGRDLMTSFEVARDYKFPSAKAARMWLGRHARHLTKHRGRALVIDRRDLDAVIDDKRKTA